MELIDREPVFVFYRFIQDATPKEMFIRIQSYDSMPSNTSITKLLDRSDDPLSFGLEIMMYYAINPDMERLTQVEHAIYGTPPPEGSTLPMGKISRIKAFAYHNLVQGHLRDAYAAAHWHNAEINIRECLDAAEAAQRESNEVTGDPEAIPGALRSKIIGRALESDYSKRPREFSLIFRTEYINL